MKKEEFLNMETAEANIDLNKLVNEDNNIPFQKGETSTTDVNISMQEEFYSEKDQEEILPTHVNYDTLGFSIPRKNNIGGK